MWEILYHTLQIILFKHKNFIKFSGTLYIQTIFIVLFSSFMSQAIITIHYLASITTFDEKFGSPIICTDNTMSIHKIHDILWNNKAHALIAKTHFPIVSSNTKHHATFTNTEVSSMFLNCLPSSSSLYRVY